MFIALCYQWHAGEDDLFECLDIFSAKLNVGKLERQEDKEYQDQDQDQVNNANSVIIFLINL